MLSSGLGLLGSFTTSENTLPWQWIDRSWHTINPAEWGLAVLVGALSKLSIGTRKKPPRNPTIGGDLTQRRPRVACWGYDVDHATLDLTFSNTSFFCFVFVRCSFIHSFIPFVCRDLQGGFSFLGCHCGSARCPHSSECAGGRGETVPGETIPVRQLRNPGILETVYTGQTEQWRPRCWCGAWP